MNPPLTPEEEQIIFDWLEQNPMPEQDENSIDLGHLRENLKLTPTQRLIRAQNMANQIIQLRKKMRAPTNG